MIKCDFNLCIYNESQECILNTIGISGAGYCDSCIIPDIPESII